MRSAVVVLGGLAVFAAGFGVALLVASPEIRERTIVVGAPADPATGAPAVSPAAAPAVSATAMPETPSTPSATTGSASIEVLVRDVAGAPFAGVEVVVEPAAVVAPRDVQRDGVEPAEERLRRAAERIRWEDAARRSGTTDAAGRCVFAGLPETTFDVTPRRAGWRFRREQAPGNRLRAGDRATFVGVEAQRTPVMVIGEDGAPAKSVTVRVLREGVAYADGWTPERPDLDLPRGDWELAAFQGPWDLIRSDPVRVRIPLETPGPVTLRLRARPSLRGRLVLPDGFESDRATVYLLRSPASGMAGEPLLIGQGTSWHSSAPMHEFTFRDLAPGAYTLGVSLGHERDAIHHSESLEIGDGITERSVVMPAPDRSTYLVVRLLDPAGAPIRNATVWAQYLEDGRTVAGSMRAGLRADGAWVLGWFDRRNRGSAGRDSVAFDAAKGAFRVTASAPGFGSIGGDIPAGSASEGDLQFAPPGSLTVAIEGYVGSSLHGRLRAYLEGKDVRTGRTQGTYADLGTLDREGRAEFPAVQPGDYDLVLTVGRGGRGIWPISRTPIFVGSAAAEGRVAIPPLHAVRILGAKEWASLRRSDDTNWAFQTDRPGSDGSIVLDCLPAGEYVAEGSGLTATFTLPGPSEVTLVPKTK